MSDPLRLSHRIHRPTGFRHLLTLSFAAMQVCQHLGQFFTIHLVQQILGVQAMAMSELHEFDVGT